MPARLSARGRAGCQMAQPSGRDYKTRQRSSLAPGRYREFLYGAAVGAFIASVAFMYVSARQHKAADLSDTPRPDPHHAARTAPDSDEPGANTTSQKFDFYHMLPNFEVVVP